MPCTVRTVNGDKPIIFEQFGILASANFATKEGITTTIIRFPVHTVGLVCMLAHMHNKAVVDLQHQECTWPFNYITR